MQANNVVVLTGRLGKDPELQYTPSGVAITKFSLAVDKPGKDRQADWHDVTIFGKMAETANELLKRGIQTTVVGSLAVDTWTTNEGQKRRKDYIKGDNFQVIWDKKKSDEGSSDGEGYGAGSDPDDEDNVPF